MKRFFTILTVLAYAADLLAQVPEKMSYQAVVRNANGDLVKTTTIGIQISILQDSETGTAVYVETHTETTNENGLVTLEIGGGTPVSGTFTDIDWSSGVYFLKSETDPTGGTNYSITGINQILSIPYALYAKTAGISDALQSQINMLKYSSAAGGVVSDIDNNVYNIVKIGTQVWMAENLRSTKYNDGTSIPHITNNAEWAALTTGAYCEYDNTPANSLTYGRLYNWYAVDNNPTTMFTSNGGKNVCPVGWHIPNDVDWTTLTDYLIINGYGFDGSGGDIGKSMASSYGWATFGTAGTVGNDQANNNKSGFTALPSGSRNLYGVYLGIGTYCYWWSTTSSNAVAYYRSIFYNYSEVDRFLHVKQAGFSVRCIKD